MGPKPQDQMAKTVAWRQDWVVYSKPAVQGGEKVLGYVGRYARRGMNNATPRHCKGKP